MNFDCIRTDAHQQKNVKSVIEILYLRIQMETSTYVMNLCRWMARRKSKRPNIA